MEQKQKAIGNNIYLVTQMDAVNALKVQTKLIKILGAGIFSLMDKGSKAQEKIATLIPALMDNFDDGAVNELVLSLYEKGVFIKVGDNPKVVDFATHFAGKAMEMWQVTAFILEANFSMGEFTGSSSPTTDEVNQI